eukprot:433626-Alexandrium_andersonii.AAC.1
MSASLVGSEMCIRDRKQPTGSGRAATTLVRWAARTKTGLGPASSGTVSYTHLTLPTICSV